jgi:hypothetical protein
MRKMIVPMVTCVLTKQMKGGPIKVMVNLAVVTVILGFDPGIIQVVVST